MQSETSEAARLRVVMLILVKGRKLFADNGKEAKRPKTTQCRRKGMWLPKMARKWRMASSLFCPSPQLLTCPLSESLSFNLLLFFAFSLFFSSPNMKLFFMKPYAHLFPSPSLLAPLLARESFLCRARAGSVSVLLRRVKQQGACSHHGTTSLHRSTEFQVVCRETSDRPL